MIVVIGSGLVAVTAAQSILEQKHDVMLITAHAEFGFPHGGCGLWDITVLDMQIILIQDLQNTDSLMI